MKIKFGKLPLHNEIIITPENEDEAEELTRWNDCVLSARYDFRDNKEPSNASLQIVKEM